MRGLAKPSFIANDPCDNQNGPFYGETLLYLPLAQERYSGQPCVDLSRYGKHLGASISDVTYEGSPYGNVMSFGNASTQGFDIPAASASHLNWTSGPLAFFVRFNTGSLSSNKAGQAGTLFGNYLYISGGYKLGLQTDGGGFFQTGKSGGGGIVFINAGTFSAGEWHTIVGYISGSGAVSLWCSGTVFGEPNTGTLSGLPDSSSQPFRVGNDTPLDPLYADLKVAELRIWAPTQEPTRADVSRIVSGLY